MSRLESNAEPSMEEILASIRKIIAEDSTGLRTPPPPKSGASYSPAPRPAPASPSPSLTPQRGFMTREAFLKSSQSEPEPRQNFAPSPSPRTLGSDAGTAPATSRVRVRDDLPAAEAPSPSLRKTEGPSLGNAFGAREELRSKESPAPNVAKESAPALNSEKIAPLEDQTVSADESESIETVEVVDIVDIEDALPSIEAKSTDKPVRETDAARIEAQLTELLSDDLNALERQSKAGTTKSNGVTPSENVPASKPAAESDPFAFDLGPSPFAAKSEPPRTVVSAPEPAPLAAPPAHPGTVEPPRASPAPSFTERSAPAQTSPFANPISAGFVAAPPVTATPPVTNTPAEPLASKPRDTFGIPSVSATLGPTRKLEPLSNAFGPPPAPPPRAIETFSPPAEPAYEPARISQPAPPWEVHRAVEPPPPAPPFGRGRPDEPGLRSGLPTMPSDFLPDRPLEDAVADLLRPLLKTWLAENMPKIVERALRREMSERLLPGQKNPQD